MYFGRIKNLIKKIFNMNKKFPKVLDVGGGFGLFSANFKKNFPKSEVHLLDILSNEIMNLISKILATKLRLNLKYHYEIDIQEKIPFKEKTFDLIFALDILEHVNNPETSLMELIRILKDNGYIFISVPTESKLLQFFRNIYNKIRPIEVNPHWNGMIKSQKEFQDCLMEKKIKILWKQLYPFSFLPKIFSYDIFYLIKKNLD